MIKIEKMKMNVSAWMHLVIIARISSEEEPKHATQKHMRRSMKTGDGLTL